MTHDELQSLVFGQNPDYGVTIWFTEQDKTVNLAFKQADIAPELYDALSAMPVLYQALSRQQVIAQALVDVVDNAEHDIANGGTTIVNLNALRGAMQDVISMAQSAQMVAQLGVAKFSDAYTKEQQMKAKK